MFGADVTQISILDNGPAYDVVPVDSLDYLFPKFTHQSPWIHTATGPNQKSGSIMEDFILIAEFSEQEGPRPVLVIPKDGGKDFDQNEFSVKILAVDHQSSIVEGCEMAEDAQVVMSDPDKNAHSFIHHIVLNDIQARGYVRPFCITYVTSDSMKVMKCYEELSTQMKKVARLMKYGNRLVFMRDLEKYLEDLSYTKAHLLISQSRSQMSTQGDSDLLNALNTIRQSMEEVSNIMANLRLLLVDAELEERFLKLERQVKFSRQQHCEGDESNSLKDFDMKDHQSEKETSGSYTDKYSPEFSLFSKSKDLKPKVLDVSTIRGKRRFDRSLRGLHELCSWGAKEGLQRLRTVREFLKRDLSSIHLDDLDTAILSPDCGVLSFGCNSIGANFLISCNGSKDLCCRKRRLTCVEPSQDNLTSLGSVESFKSLSSSFQSFLDEDTMYSANSSMVDAGSGNASCHFTLERQNSIHTSDGYGTRDSTELEPGESDFMFDHEDSISLDMSTDLETTVYDISTSLVETLKIGSYVDCTNIGKNENNKDFRKERSVSSISEFYTVDIDKDLKCFAKGCKCGKNSGKENESNSITQNVECSCSNVINGATGVSKSKQECAKRNDTDKLGGDVQFTDLQKCNKFNDKGIRSKDEHTKSIVASQQNLKNEFSINIERDLGKTENSSIDESKSTNDKACFDTIPDSFDDSGVGSRKDALCHDKTVIAESHSNINDIPDENNIDSKTVVVRETDRGEIRSDQVSVIDESKKKSSADCTGAMVYTSDEDRTCSSTDLDADIRNKFLDGELKETGRTCDKCDGASNDNESSTTDTESGDSERDEQRMFVNFQKFQDHISPVQSEDDIHRRYSRKRWKMTHLFSNASEFDSGSNCLQKVLCNFNNLQHVVYSLLSGRPVVVIGTRKQEYIVREFVHALTIFTPVVSGHEATSLVCQIKQLKVTDVHKFRLRGIIKTDRRPVEYIVPTSIRRYITLVDVEKMLVYCQPYQGSLLNFVSAVYNKKKSFKSEQALLCFIQMCLLEISTKAFNFYHCITSRDAESDFSGVVIPRKSAMLELTAEKYLNKAGLLSSDCKIIKHMSEIVKIQQIEEEFKCKYLTDSPVYPFGITYQVIQTFRL